MAEARRCRFAGAPAECSREHKRSREYTSPASQPALTIPKYRCRWGDDGDGVCPLRPLGPFPTAYAAWSLNGAEPVADNAFNSTFSDNGIAVPGRTLAAEEEVGWFRSSPAQPLASPPPATRSGAPGTPGILGDPAGDRFGTSLVASR